MNTDKTPDPVRLYRFYMWVANPIGLFVLNSALAYQREVELLHLMQSDNKSAAAIAWAEYGRRRGFADINFRSESVGLFEVEVQDLIVEHHVAFA